MLRCKVGNRYFVLSSDSIRLAEDMEQLNSYHNHDDLRELVLTDIKSIILNSVKEELKDSKLLTTKQ